MNKDVCKFYKKDKRRIVKGLGFFKGGELKNLKELVKRSREKYGNKVAFRYKENEEIIEKSYIDFDSDIDWFGTALCASGLKGSKIAAALTLFGVAPVDHIKGARECVM